MKKVLKHLVRAQAALQRADREILPAMPGRDAVAPWLHTTQTYLETTILGAEQVMTGATGPQPNVYGFEKQPAIA